MQDNAIGCENFAHGASLNPKTAKVLNLTISEAFLLRADEVIE